MGGGLEVSRACDRLPSKFQNFERHCSETALDDVKCGYTAVALKIWKLAREPIAGPWDLQTPPIFDYSLSNGGLKSSIRANQSDQKILTWQKNWPKKSWTFQVFILLLGVRKNVSYDFSGIFLRKNGPEYGNHEWDDGNLGSKSETTETRDPWVRRRKPVV